MCVFSVDARDNNMLGKFINDSPAKFANCLPKVLVVDGKPRVALFSVKKILCGTELRYDYGGHVPWRKVMMIITPIREPSALTFHYNTYTNPHAHLPT